MAQYVYSMLRVGKVVPPGKHILKNISLSFFPGAKIGVLGLNGSGKSTLLKIMAGIDTDIEGEAIPQTGLKIGYLPQEPQLDESKDVRGNVEEAVADVAHALKRIDEVYAAYAEEDADFDALAKEKGYAVSPVNGLKALDVYVGSVGENRRIVKWAFEEDTDLNKTKRFDLDEKGYAVVMLTDKQEKGLMSASNAFTRVEPILIKNKKAAILEEKMDGDSLDAIAKDNNTKVESFTNVTIGAPTIAGIGIEPGVVSAATVSKKNTLVQDIIGEKGVFALVTKTVNIPKKDAAKANVKAIANRLKTSVSSQLFNGLKEEATIEDYRSTRY